MKKILLMGFFGLSTMFGISQEGPTDAISLLPIRANGFLILNDSYYSNVASWRVLIQTREFNTETNKFDYTDVDAFQLVGKNYTKMKSSYNDGLHFITVQGLNQSRGVEIVQGPLQMNPNADPLSVHCGWQCIGSTYAYKLELWESDNVVGGPQYIAMNSAYPESGEPYYYQWVSAAAWNAFIQGDFEYYNLLNFSLGSAINPNNLDKVIHIDLPQGTWKMDAQHTPIYGSVYGVSKSLGPWIDVQADMKSNSFGGGGYNCVQNFTWAMNQVNAGDDTPLPLTCDGGESWFDEQEAGETEAIINEPCFAVFCTNCNDESWTEQNIESFLDLIECQEENGGGNLPGPFVWPSFVHSILVRPYNSTENNGNVLLTEDSFVNAEGNLTGQTINFSKGLNHIAIVYSDGSYDRAFFESAETFSSALSMSNFLGVNAYEVPIQGNSFNLDFSATANVKFTYELKNAAGSILFTKRYEISKDKIFTEVITVDAGIPSGLLFNSFKFTDGSESNFQTIK